MKAVISIDVTREKSHPPLPLFPWHQASTARKKIPGSAPSVPNDIAAPATFISSLFGPINVGCVVEMPITTAAKNSKSVAEMAASLSSHTVSPLIDRCSAHPSHVSPSLSRQDGPGCWLVIV